MRAFDALALLVLALTCLPFGYGSLVDLDIGWHLAGGLWMLEHLKAPRGDFLGLPGHSWVAYSWLPEVLIAYVFKRGGFPALQLLQFVFVWMFVSTLYYFASVRAADLPGRFRSALVVFAALPLFAPFWHLRPQLLSLFLFVPLLAWADAGRLTFFHAAVLCVLWANIHVFWVLVPVMFFFSSFREDPFRAVAFTVALAACGMCTPYAMGNIDVIREYLLEHEVGYSLILEFHPLAPELGLVFWTFAGAGAALAWAAFVLAKSGRRFLPFFAIIFFVAAFFQRKYLPFFGVALVFTVIEALRLRIIPAHVARENRSSWSPLKSAFAGMLLLVLFALTFDSWRRPPALPDRTRDLISLAALLGEKSAGTRGAVLNEFDDGGWLGLGLYLARPAGYEESPLKTVVDGRTLVMGPERLAEYAALRAGGPDFCDRAAMRKPEYAVLPAGSPLYENLRAKCGSTWKAERTLGEWTVFRRIG